MVFGHHGSSICYGGMLGCAIPRTAQDLLSDQHSIKFQQLAMTAAELPEKVLRYPKQMP